MKKNWCISNFGSTEHKLDLRGVRVPFFPPKLHLLIPVSPLVNQFPYDNVFSGQIIITFLCEIPFIYLSVHLLRFSINIIKGDFLVSHIWKEAFPFYRFSMQVGLDLKLRRILGVEVHTFPAQINIINTDVAQKELLRFQQWQHLLF